MSALGMPDVQAIGQKNDAVLRSVRPRDAGDALELTLDDGRTFSLSAELLWRECPSALGKVRRMKGIASPPEGVRIVAVDEIGLYAVNIAFSDGHNRGIYPWSYLMMLARRPKIDDFIIAS